MEFEIFADKIELKKKNSGEGQSYLFPHFKSMGIALIAVMSGLTCKRGERVIAALY